MDIGPTLTEELYLIPYASLQGVLKSKTTCHSPREAGSEESHWISYPVETLHSPALRAGASVVQGDMNVLSSKSDTPSLQSLHLLNIENLYTLDNR
jgi:hypothetical protein